MTTQKKKTTRRKAYKNMSVSELVKARAELVEKMQEIDSILNQAVQAVGAVKRRSVSNYGKTTSQEQTGVDPFATNPAFNSAFQTPLGAQVAISQDAPTMQRPQRNTPDQSSGFSIFDADAHARQQAAAEEQYLVENPQVAQEVGAQFDFNKNEISDEIANLKKQISQHKANAENTESTEG